MLQRYLSLACAGALLVTFSACASTSNERPTSYSSNVTTPEENATYGGNTTDQTGNTSGSIEPNASGRHNETYSNGGSAYDTNTPGHSNKWSTTPPRSGMSPSNGSNRGTSGGANSMGAGASQGR